MISTDGSVLKRKDKMIMQLVKEFQPMASIAISKGKLYINDHKVR